MTDMLQPDDTARSRPRRGLRSTFMKKIVKNSIAMFKTIWQDTLLLRIAFRNAVQLNRSLADPSPR